MTEKGLPADQIDTSRPHPARMYDYYLGGRDNYEVDREAAERVLTELPVMRPAARANRGFLQRAVRAVVTAGVRQIVDVGTGIPTSPNTHEVAQAIAPDVRVAYVDNDPIVGVHAGARLTGTRNTTFALADVRDPQSVLEHPVVRELIDFDEPVALMLIAVLHFVTEEEGPRRIVEVLGDALPAGSHLVLSHATADFHPEGFPQSVSVYRKATATLNARRHDEIVRLFDGFEMLEPGLVQVPLWRPDGPLPPQEELAKMGIYGGVGRKR